MQNYFIAVDDNNESLTHYGVLGMRWHHRKASEHGARADSYDMMAKTTWSRIARNSAKAKAEKYRAKANTHLEKNRENIKAGNYDKVKGEKYTKVTAKNKAAGALRNSTKYMLKSLALTPITTPIVAGITDGKKGFQDTLNAELNLAKAVSHKVRKKREARQSRNAYANAYGLPQFTNRQRSSINRGRNFIN